MMIEFAAGLVNALICVRAKVVALRLQEIGRQTGTTVRVIVVERRAHGRNGNAQIHGRLDDRTPGVLCLGDHLLEVGIKQQVRKLGIGVERLFDLAEEARADDAALTPDQRDLAVVQVHLYSAAAARISW